MRITYRDVVVACGAVVLTLTAVAAQSPAAPILGSTLFDWAALTATPNRTGEVRRVVRAPTATLDELEIHITTLRPGEESHPPHQDI